MSPFRLVYCKPCHLPIELEHKAFWAVKQYNIKVGQKVLFFNIKLRLFLGKLQSKWIGPYVVTNVFAHDAVTIKSLDISKECKENGHQLKHYYKNFVEHSVENL